MSHSYVEKNLKTNKNLKLNFEKNTLLTAVSKMVLGILPSEKTPPGKLLPMKLPPGEFFPGNFPYQKFHLEYSNPFHQFEGILKSTASHLTVPFVHNWGKERMCNALPPVQTFLMSRERLVVF